MYGKNTNSFRNYYKTLPIKVHCMSFLYTNKEGLVDDSTAYLISKLKFCNFTGSI
jgi:hypothetical protein